MQVQLVVVVVEGRVELVRPMDPAAIDDHHHLLLGFAEDRHHLMEILAQLLSIKVGHDFREDCGGPILDRPHDTEQHAAGHTTPGAIVQPRLAFEGLLTFALTLAQRARGEASALRFAPPTCTGQGKAPQDSFVFIEQNNLAPASPVLQGGEVERGIREVCGGGLKAPGGTIGAYLLFFNAQRMLSRPRWTPVCWANTVASSRQLHWEWREPCCRGS